MNRFDWLEFDAPREATPAGTESATGRRTAPRDSETFYYEARRMRRAGFFPAAAQFYERAVGLDEYHYPAWAELVDSLVRAGELDRAERHSHAALDNYRKVRLFYASRALVLAHREVFDEAFNLSDISLEGEPSWYARCVRAELLLRFSAGNRGEALALLDNAIDLAKDLWEPHLLGGMALLDAGYAALAAGYLSEAAHADPRAAAGWLWLGDSFRALRLYDQAMFYYQKVIEISPQHELALARQKDCAPLLYGLTRAFRRESLRKRWNREYDRLKAEQEPESHDF